jgi:hypothetical protein
VGWVWVKRWYPQDNRGAKWSLLIHCGCGLGQAVIAADACLLRACGRPVQGQQAKTRIFVRNGATIGPRTHSPPAWRIGPATLQIGNSKRAGVGIGPWSAASLPPRQGCNLAAAALQPKLPRLSVRYWSYRHKNHAPGYARLRAFRPRLAATSGGSKRAAPLARSWSPDAACDVSRDGRHRVNFVARHPSRLIARLCLWRLSFL